MIEKAVTLAAAPGIEPGCPFVGPLWIGNGGHIEAGVSIERSVVLDGANGGASATAREVIGSGTCRASREGEADGAPAARGWGDARRRRHSLRGAA